MKRYCWVIATILWIVTSRNGTTEPRNNVYLQHNLVSDLPGHAEHRDPNLVNPWGIAFSPSGPFWIADNHTGVSTVYDARGRSLPSGTPLVVAIPPPKGGTPPAAPTGIVFNGTPNFQIAPGKAALFIFATEDGTISGWNPMVDATHAVLKSDQSPSGAVYKGLAIGNDGTSDFLYATNFNAGTVDVFDHNFSLASHFSDPTLPAGFAPFGIRNLGGKLYVTFAKQDDAKHDDVSGPGNGFVDIFDTKGQLLKRLINGGVTNPVLNSPWGLTIAPEDFGDLSGALLVGNFGDGTINGFDLVTGAPRGTLRGPSGRPITIQGLWALTFGNGGQGGDRETLYFTAGIPGPGKLEDHGLFGQIRAQHGEDNNEDDDE